MVHRNPRLLTHPDQDVLKSHSPAFFVRLALKILQRKSPAISIIAGLSKIVGGLDENRKISPQITVLQQVKVINC